MMLLRLVYHITRLNGLRFLYGSLKYISEWEKETGADIVMNGALFEGNGKPIETFKSDGKVISLSNWCKKGIGLKRL